MRVCVTDHRVLILVPHQKHHLTCGSRDNVEKTPPQLFGHTKKIQHASQVPRLWSLRGRKQLPEHPISRLLMSQISQPRDKICVKEKHYIMTVSLKQTVQTATELHFNLLFLLSRATVTAL